MDIPGIADRVVRSELPDSAFDIHAFLELVRSDTSMRTAFENVRTSSHRFYGHFDVNRWKRCGECRNMVEWEGRFIVELDTSYVIIDSIRYSGVFRRKHRRNPYFIEQYILDLLGPYTWFSDRTLPTKPRKDRTNAPSAINTTEKLDLFLDRRDIEPAQREAERYFDRYDSSASSMYKFVVTNDCFCPQEYKGRPLCLDVKVDRDRWKRHCWSGTGDLCFDVETKQLIKKSGYMSMRNLFIFYWVDNRIESGEVFPSFISSWGSLPIGSLSREHFNFAFEILD